MPTDHERQTSAVRYALIPLTQKYQSAAARRAPVANHSTKSVRNGPAQRPRFKSATDLPNAGVFLFAGRRRGRAELSPARTPVFTPVRGGRTGTSTSGVSFSSEVGKAGETYWRFHFRISNICKSYQKLAILLYFYK